MVSRMVRGMAAILMISSLSGCAFLQWTDHAFYGSADCPPAHPNRQWAFAAIAPWAWIGDVITSPVQGIMLAAGGDHSLYHHEQCLIPSDRSRGGPMQ